MPNNRACRFCITYCITHLCKVYKDSVAETFLGFYYLLGLHHLIQTNKFINYIRLKWTPVSIHFPLKSHPSLHSLSIEITTHLSSFFQCNFLKRHQRAALDWCTMHNALLLLLIYKCSDCRYSQGSQRGWGKWVKAVSGPGYNAFSEHRVLGHLLWNGF